MIAQVSSEHIFHTLIGVPDIVLVYCFGVKDLSYGYKEKGSPAHYCA